MKDQKYENDCIIVSEKKYYVEPQLKKLGDVNDFTKGTGGATPDASGQPATGFVS